MILANTKAPDFELINNEGEKIKLSDFIGKPVLLYFYPKDNTPGYTTEACNFRDDYEEYRKQGIEIVGVSPDSMKSHEKFISKHRLPFSLLADTDHKICEMYGVWGKKKMFGKEYFGVLRTTFLIGKNGNVVKVFKGVKPKHHSKEVIAGFK
ncbi:MAG: thioredoxin-dependent thiol peroxidase [Anaerolineaceae bacterium]|nr:thioredoxin-dependent thiol peroxidase [Anaerolineaceae bacterium]